MICNPLLTIAVEAFQSPAGHLGAPSYTGASPAEGFRNT
jgi:hypothetical protein